MIGVFRNIYRVRIEGEGVAENQMEKNLHSKTEAIRFFWLEDRTTAASSVCTSPNK